MDEKCINQTLWICFDYFYSQIRCNVNLKLCYKMCKVGVEESVIAIMIAGIAGRVEVNAS